MHENAYHKQYEGVNQLIADNERTAAEIHWQELKKLYVQVLRFQARTSCRLSQNTILGITRDMFLRDDWGEMLEEIKAQEVVCQRLFDNIKNEVDMSLRDEKQEQRVRSLLDKLDDVRDTIREIHFSDEESKCFSTLRTCDYQAAKDRNPEHLPGTCKWLFNHSTYQEWTAASPKARLVWVTADPGCGKSVLAKTVVDQYHSSEVCFFFFKSENAISRSATHALCALLHQLCSARPAMIRHVLPAFKRNGDKLIALFDELWTAFESVVQDPANGKVICVLDALDECSDTPKETFTGSSRPPAEERRKLLQRIAALAGSTNSLKMFLTSRPYTVIGTALFYKTGLNKNQVHLTGEDEAERTLIEEEIKIVIKSRVADFQERRTAEGINDFVHETIRSHLNSMKNRTYLWISAVFNILDAEVGAPETELNTVIKTLPENVDTAYESILIQTPKDKQADLKAVLHIMLAAFYPLSIEEMNIALAVSKESLHLDMGSLLPKEAFRKWIRNLCGFFITVVKRKAIGEGKLREEFFFVHESAREFLLLKQDDQEAGGWRGSFKSDESHTLLARICIEFLRSAYNESDKRIHTFEHYATHSWYRHCQRGTWSENLRQRVSSFMLDHGEITTSYQRWQRKFDCYNLDWPSLHVVGLDAPTPFFLARLLGWVWLLEEIASSGNFDWYQKTNENNTGLVVASAKGRVHVVDFLIAHVRADISGIEDCLALPLENAVEWGRTRIVQMLLDAGANVNYVNRGQYYTAIQAAVSAGHSHIVEMLITAGADVDAVSTSSTQTALQKAVAEGHLDIINILLAAGADVNAPSNSEYDRVALKIAVEAKNIVVERLLAAGADINMIGTFKNKKTALQIAAKRGYTDIVKKLLAYNADANANAGTLTALQLAAKHGHDQVVLQLLAHGADVNAAALTKDGLTALQAAALDGHENIVERLLASGADVNAAPAVKFGVTALQAAALGGHENIVERLLASGADVNAAPARQYGFTALQAAVQSGRIGVVAKLLASGANIDAPSSPKQLMALERAIHSCNIEIAEMLVAAGADVNLSLNALYSKESELSEGWEHAWSTAMGKEDMLYRLVMKLRKAGAKEEHLPLKYR